MTDKLLTKHHLEVLSLKGGFTGWSESTLFSKCHIVGNHMFRLNYYVICCSLETLDLCFGRFAICPVFTLFFTCDSLSVCQSVCSDSSLCLFSMPVICLSVPVCLPVCLTIIQPEDVKSDG